MAHNDYADWLSHNITQCVLFIYFIYKSYLSRTPISATNYVRPGSPADDDYLQ